MQLYESPYHKNKTILSALLTCLTESLITLIIQYLYDHDDGNTAQLLSWYIHIKLASEGLIRKAQTHTHTLA